MRKIMKFSTLLVLAVTAFGCHAQVPPTTHNVTLNWGATTTGGTPPYTYIMSRISLTAGTPTCPPVNLSTPNYTPLNSASPVTPTNYIDTTATGTVCYTVQAEDSVKSVGGASNTAGPLVTLTNPNAPVTLGGDVTADVKQPALPKPSMGPDAPKTVAHLEAHFN